MRVLVACEESGIVTNEFRLLGHEAYSCDILPTSGSLPEYHMQCDVRKINLTNWDLIIAFPPCTDIAVSGAAWFEKKRADGRQQKGIEFFLFFTDLPCEKVAIENPIGIMSTRFRKPDQIVQPYFFGDPFKKSTCLWLKNLPKLVPTDMVDSGKIITYASGKKMPEWYANTPVKNRSKIRSKTFIGLAKAMAEQWGGKE